MIDPADLTATEAAARIQQSKLRPVELAEACLDRMRRRDPLLKAFVHVDHDLVIGYARALEKSGPRGPLWGLPLAVKDVLDTSDMPSCYGSSIWADFRPRADAACVALARSAGAIILGKTATTEFATRRPAETVNPVNNLHTPGGSSSGSAAAVGASLCPFAFGTQTAGSIIRPAAFCGIVGYKPTFGLIHRAGMKVMSETLDTIGVLARSIADCALLVGAISKRNLGNPDQKPHAAPRLALVTGPSPDAAPETLERLFEVADLLRRRGARVTEAKLPNALHDAFLAHGTVMNAEIAEALSWELAQHPEQLSEYLLESIRGAQLLPPKALDEGRAAFERARQAFAAFMTEYDAIITPSAIGEAPLGLGHTGDPVFNILWSALHVPCANVPAGTGPNGLPLGIQVVADRSDDRALLSWARWIQAQLG
jgi:Asp-tRNA(Asn)/Glu-tRNA(Gln) amidotransferase A subunit family amidase